MKKAKEIGIALTMILGALILGILLQGLMNTGESKLGGLEDAQVLDSFAVADSKVTLLKTPDGDLFFLEYRKNLLLPRYEQVWAMYLKEEGMNTAVTTPLCEYVAAVEGERLVHTEPKTGFRWSAFRGVYGTWVLLVLLVESFLYDYGMRKSKKRERPS